MHSPVVKRNIIISIVFLVLLLIGSVLLWKINASTQYPNQVLLPDSSFLFDCEGKDRNLLEINIEGFLLSKGFKVLNLGKIQREHKVHILETDIIGLDQNRGIIEFVSLPSSKGTYSFGFTSPPPTRRSFDIEESLLDFTKNKLKCEVRQRSGSMNGMETKRFYDAEVKRMEGLFREAKELQKNKKTNGSDTII